MWPQSYTPISDNLALSAIVAALPIFSLLYLLGIARKPAWISSLTGVGVAALVALFAYRMPPMMVLSSALYGAAYGLLPIGWIVFTAILLYRLTVETGKFEIIKDSIGSLTGDRRLQALLVAFAFGAFLEGATGFGTPVAVAAAMLTGLGFEPFFAAAICLFVDTSPVAFGAVGIPLVMLQAVTNLPLMSLSADTALICAPLAAIVPAYLMLLMGGVKALKDCWLAAAVSGITFAVTEFIIAETMGPYLAALLAVGRDGYIGRSAIDDDFIGGWLGRDEVRVGGGFVGVVMAGGGGRGVGWGDGVILAGLVDLDGIAIEVGVSEVVGGAAEIHEGEIETFWCPHGRGRRGRRFA